MTMRRIPYVLEVLHFSRAPAHYREVLDHYEKRLAAGARFESREISAIPDRENMYILDAEGQALEDGGLEGLIRREGAAGRKLTFVVGPAEGFGQDVKGSHRRLSLAPMTMQHDLARLVLLEQIYRAVLAISGTDYSK